MEIFSSGEGLDAAESGVRTCLRPLAMAIRNTLVLGLGLLLVVTGVRGEDTSSVWQERDLPFRPLNLTSNGRSLWACGTDEGIAVSSDGGEHWAVKRGSADGPSVIFINFVNEKFGYAGGTNGLFLTTEDGGKTWIPHSAGDEAFLQISFADPQHGLARTASSLRFTSDGGAHWSAVSEGQNAPELKQFPYTFALIALDGSHMAVMLKRGAEQADGQGFLVTQDGGKSWKFLTLPNVTLYSFLRYQNEYWTVGTEVVHKDQRGGGYGVPVAMHSSDGEKWVHSETDLSACRLQMCTVCTTQGCLDGNGMMADPFSANLTAKLFPPTRQLTTKWAATESTICFVDNLVRCAPLRGLTGPSPELENSIPVVVAPLALGSQPPKDPRCVHCTLDNVLIDQEAHGTFNIKLTFHIAKNGTVDNVQSEGAPSPALKSRIEAQVQQFIFEPYRKDGSPVEVHMTTTVRVNVIKPR